MRAEGLLAATNRAYPRFTALCEKLMTMGIRPKDVDVSQIEELRFLDMINRSLTSGLIGLSTSERGLNASTLFARHRQRFVEAFKELNHLIDEDD